MTPHRVDPLTKRLCEYECEPKCSKRTIHQRWLAAWLLEWLIRAVCFATCHTRQLRLRLTLGCEVLLLLLLWLHRLVFATLLLACMRLCDFSVLQLLLLLLLFLLLLSLQLPLLLLALVLVPCRLCNRSRLSPHSPRAHRHFPFVFAVELVYLFLPFLLLLFCAEIFC